MNKTESVFQKQCIDLLRSKGCYVYKNAQNMYTEKGRPDLTVCIPVSIADILSLENLPSDYSNIKIGLFVGLELKREGHKKDVSLAQQIVAKQIEKAGGKWYLVDSLDELQDILKNYAIQ